MADKGNGKDHPRAEQVAIYVADLARQLADLARQLKVMAARHDMPELAYLLDLVRAEAELKAKPAPRAHA